MPRLVGLSESQILLSSVHTRLYGQLNPMRHIIFGAHFSCTGVQ